MTVPAGTFARSPRSSRCCVAGARSASSAGAPAIRAYNAVRALFGPGVEGSAASVATPNAIASRLRALGWDEQEARTAAAVLKP